jgi:hypothetical protein
MQTATQICKVKRVMWGKLGTDITIKEINYNGENSVHSAEVMVL